MYKLTLTVLWQFVSNSLLLSLSLSVKSENILEELKGTFIITLILLYCKEIICEGYFICLMLLLDFHPFYFIRLISRDSVKAS